uniref:Uncharacterized protein n=1 Tax=Haemonchus contortus TaxID=6289 RepID=W6NFJ8_HAECO
MDVEVGSPLVELLEMDNLQVDKVDMGSLQVDSIVDYCRMVDKDQVDTAALDILRRAGGKDSNQVLLDLDNSKHHVGKVILRKVILEVVDLKCVI